MNLERRIEALEKVSERLAEPQKVALALWNVSKETKDQAIDRALAENCMTREEISKPRLDGLPRLIVIHYVKPNPSRFSNTLTADSSALVGRLPAHP